MSKAKEPSENQSNLDEENRIYRLGQASGMSEATKLLVLVKRARRQTAELLTLLDCILEKQSQRGVSNPQEGAFCVSCACPMDGFSEHHPSCEFRPRKA